MATTITRSALDHDLHTIRDDILRLASLVEEQTERAVRALKNRDIDLAREVASVDAHVNELRYKVEEQCLNAIARHQPAAADLRLIVASMHMAVEMERMADHAAGIAGVVVRMGHEPLLKPLIDIPRMQTICCEMLHQTMEAYIRNDASLARTIVRRDEEVDQLYNQVLRELVTYMVADPRTTPRATYLLWVAHNLERTADRVTNLCERIQFAVTGELGDLSPEEDEN
ncbi:MAG: phosphate signaling complex protein PhoU [Anaerolineae bacterium]|nr:phosphate signaling complex protein PhoU [Thermoflexales bacterium]MDW8407613.1 phosphate signaling complex protein PhoU [Anaerolineae bacterium]